MRSVACPFNVPPKKRKKGQKKTPTYFPAKIERGGKPGKENDLLFSWV